MVMIKLKNGIEFYMDKKLKDNVDVLIDGCKDDDDFLLIFDGKESSGKSKFMRQVGAYCADKLKTPFSVDNIHFQLDDYIDFSIEAPYYTVCVLDEARKVLNKKNSRSKQVVKFTNYISECRAKRQIHLIGLPAYHDLDSYIANWRGKMLIHLHKWFEKDSKRDSGFKLCRGEYTAYTVNNKTQKWHEIRYYYPKQFETKGTFKNVEVIDIKAYDEKKGQNLEQKYHSKFEQQREHKYEKIWRDRFISLAKHMKNNRKISIGEIADSCNMEVRNVTNAMSLSRQPSKL